jgi:hypothetical protein
MTMADYDLPHRTQRCSLPELTMVSLRIDFCTLLRRISTSKVALVYSDRPTCNYHHRGPFAHRHTTAHKIEQSDPANSPFGFCWQHFFESRLLCPTRRAPHRRFEIHCRWMVRTSLSNPSRNPLLLRNHQFLARSRCRHHVERPRVPD